jgi:predicted Zn-dependent protease
LAYSRDFEREADRLGFQTMTQAGYDVRGMGDFFGRLQQAGRVYENNAPVYMRSHPLTVERISDMQNRAQGAPYRQVPTAWTFSWCAPSCAQMGTPQRQPTSSASSCGKRSMFRRRHPLRSWRTRC